MKDEYKDIRILLVEDDIALASGLKEALALEKMEVTTAATVKEAKLALDNNKISGFDVMVLDLTLPDGSGLDILKKARIESFELAVIILSAKSSELDKVVGLELGADDYLCKPFSLRELHARIKALIRRFNRNAGGGAPEIFKYKDLTVNSSSREVFVNNKAIKLSFTEFEILKLLILNKNIVIERQLLIERVWSGIFIDLRSVDPHISRLRKKIAPYGVNIETLPNIGYMFKI
jgi:two-component system alkaline phosphatase synthesis response regulator PhoP